MAWHPAWFLPGRSGGLTLLRASKPRRVSKPLPRVGREAPAREPGPTAQALGPHEARTSSILPASLFALMFPWADVFPEAPCCTGSRGQLSPRLQGPGGCRPTLREARFRPGGAGGTRRSLERRPKPAAWARLLPRLREGVVLSGNGEVKSPPPGSEFQELRFGRLAPGS